ncbi:MAG: DUF3344 domain-containing protein [Methanoregula sp.]|jgi:hypothetical protein|nr:DUF3344 domain-containing protein [Methanoregula sp.]
MSLPRSRTILFFLLLLSLAGPATATYGGDHTLNATYFGDIKGGYLFDMGTSVYKGSVLPGDTYNVTYSLDLPADARMKFQRLYIYWAWSRIGQKAVYPDFRLHDSRQPASDLVLAGRYPDSKGFVSNYDFYSGVDAFELSSLQPGHNAFSITCEQAGLPNSSLILFGIGMLAVYESKDGKNSFIWVKEGSDLMYSSYGISPEMATSEMTFEGTLPKGKIDTAELFLIAPSGGYSRDIEVDLNKLMVNRLEEEKTPPLIRTIFSLLFPNYKGKEWSDIFSLDNTTQIGFETKEIKPYLKTENNRVTVQDRGDYMQLTNAILTITYTGEIA